MFNIYWECEQKSRKYQRIICNYVFCELFVYFVAICISLYNIYIGHFDTSAWSSPYNLIVPFDTSTVWGWYLYLFANFNMGMTYTASATSATSYFVVCCLYIRTACDHFDKMMQHTSDTIVQLRNASEPLRPKLLSELKLKMAQAIEIHVKIFE